MKRLVMCLLVVLYGCGEYEGTYSFDLVHTSQAHIAEIVGHPEALAASIQIHDDRKGDKCIIYVQEMSEYDSQQVYEMAIGHEMLHCIGWQHGADGKWN